ncbi:MAG: XdhC family protein, partial [Planctomycetota bacterium]
MNVFEEIVARAGAFGLATVIATEGSAPAQQAMKMLVGAEGRVAGTVGGGRVEAAVIETARAVRDGAAPEILSFTLDDELADEGGMICGGTVRILVERVEGGAPWADAAAELVRTGRRGALVARIGDAVERELLRGADADAHLATEDARYADG